MSRHTISEPWRNDPFIRECADGYLAARGMERAQPRGRVAMERARGIRIADTFETMPHRPDDPCVAAAYEQFAREIGDQFEFVLCFAGMSMEPWLRSGQPYRGSTDMFRDVYCNRHLYFFTTSSGYGEACGLNNPLRAPTGTTIDGHELLVNDMFRCVHDFFGHALAGFEFGPSGEESAWLEHSRMFSPLARAALTTETRGQSCWFNFGAHLRDEHGRLRTRGQERWIPRRQRPFPPQKAGLLPAWASGVEVIPSATPGRVHARPLAGWSATAS